jgi:hypothetical protein
VPILLQIYEKLLILVPKWRNKKHFSAKKLLLAHALLIICDISLNNHKKNNVLWEKLLELT